MMKNNSDDNLPLNKIFKLHSLIIVVTPVFQEDTEVWSTSILDECLYDL